MVLVGAGTVAYPTFGGGGPQPAEALPPTAVGYLRVDLDPSAAQKVQAIRLLNRFPSVAEGADWAEDTPELRRALFERIADRSPVNVGVLRPGVSQALTDAGVEPEVIEDIDPIEALGLSWSVPDEGEVRGSLRIVVG